MKTMIFALISSFLLLAGVVFIFISSPAPIPEVGDEINNDETIYFNIIVLLDLSDRIDPSENPNQAEKDTEIIQGIISVFEEEVRKKLFLFTKDRICIVVAKQPTNYDEELLGIVNQLRINMEGSLIGGVGGKPKFTRSKKRLLTNVDKLYKLAMANPDFIGADIWAFLRANL
jgi:hypothetical protein